MPTASSAHLTYTSHNLAQTQALGQLLGALLRPGDVVCLSGDLGAGKTALAQGIGRGWGARERVTSPTFTLVHEHRREADAAVFYHVDSYRLDGAGDAWGIGLEDLWHDDGFVVIEWPERIQAALPDERLWIDFTFLGAQQRHLALQASGARYVGLLAALRERLSAAG
ncbi:MAG: tRNA (adenosine(37)-N6)-threonylcarbamoyltransferase complex ATPase subunit type 1 TsaE [Anaerolineae bacterium]|nr:tRNA (adenosine(37)-N6)-threonylcarbamoyltransferase complex ATPase subunit type 1 TsaE [Anaerolineae bacterium]